MPEPSSARTTASWPLDAAQCSAVQVLAVTSSMAAPAARSTPTAAARAAAVRCPVQRGPATSICLVDAAQPGLQLSEQEQQLVVPGCQHQRTRRPCPARAAAHAYARRPRSLGTSPRDTRASSAGGWSSSRLGPASCVPGGQEAHLLHGKPRHAAVGPSAERAWAARPLAHCNAIAAFDALLPPNRDWASGWGLPDRCECLSHPSEKAATSRWQLV